MLYEVITDEFSELPQDEALETEAPRDEAEEDSPLVETIIMEGEFVRDAVEEERLEAERKKARDADLEKARITSYNVCYTKLLRHRSRASP